MAKGVSISSLKSSTDGLLRLYRRGIVVREVAEALISLDASTGVDRVRSFLKEKDFDVVGVSSEGCLRGYVGLADLDGQPLLKAIHRVRNFQTLSDDTPIAELIGGLNVHERLFVTALGSIAGIVTRADLQKLPVRMWLFGMVSLLEMELLRIVKHYFRDDTWKQHISSGRVGQATRFYNLNRARNQQAALVDYIALSDKYAVLRSRADLMRRLGLSARPQSDSFFGRLANLRNDLAHANKLSVANWQEMTQTISKLIDVVGKANQI